MKIIAVDPGINGAVVWTDTDNPGRAIWFRMTSISKYHRIIRSLKTDDCVGVIECQTGCAGIRVSAPAMFKFGTTYGAWLATFHAMGIKLHEVPPQKWMKALDLGTRGTRKAAKGASPQERSDIIRFNAKAKTLWKQKLASEARRLYPRVNVILANADALLIAEYARRFIANR